MASAYFKKFAIDNGLTIDYGYMYGKYKNFYISLKESLGSMKTLYIITNIGENKEDLREVFKVYSEEEIPNYCITDMKVLETSIQITFELDNSKSDLIVEFLDKFIASYNEKLGEHITYCPICKQKIANDDKVAIIDIAGILTPAHENCYDKGKEHVKEEILKKDKEINKDTKGYKNGLLGAILYGLIYMAILIILFFFMQFILIHSDSGTNVAIFQYLPVLAALSACPIIYTGYDTFKGKKGTTKYIIILWVVIISTLLGTFLGFVASLLVLDTGNSFIELLQLIGRLITCKDVSGYPTFRWGFYLYIVIALGLAILSMVFKFSGKKEMDEANSSTFEKLD
ncbi:MAG: hypothetical protein SOU19_01945 [Candidatus Caccosoma sp.]|nr:hypothetical protein [Candidatus Caccosoma sp.]